jgi:glycosyl transferase family 25
MRALTRGDTVEPFWAVDGKTMRINVISLERTPERLADFRTLNWHLQNTTIFKAVDGSNLSNAELETRGLIVLPIHYSSGALGCMMSHTSLWEQAANSGEIMTVCEDDAIFNRNFERDALAILKELPDDTDIVYWGWNFDAKTAIELAPSILPCITTLGRNALPQEIDVFQATDLRPAICRLLRAMGIICYTVTPHGASRLRQLCLPVRDETWEFPECGLRIPNIGIDVGMANAIPTLRAYCSFPPLVMSLNDPAKSTILREDKQRHR